MTKNDTLAVLRVGQGELTIRRTCTCGLCRAYREEPQSVIRSLEENRERGGQPRGVRVIAGRSE